MVLLPLVIFGAFFRLLLVGVPPFPSFRLISLQASCPYPGLTNMSCWKEGGVAGTIMNTYNAKFELCEKYQAAVGSCLGAQCKTYGLKDDEHVRGLFCSNVGAIATTVEGESAYYGSMAKCPEKAFLFGVDSGESKLGVSRFKVLCYEGSSQDIYADHRDAYYTNTFCGQGYVMIGRCLEHNLGRNCNREEGTALCARLIRAEECPFPCDRSFVVPIAGTTDHTIELDAESKHGVHPLAAPVLRPRSLSLLPTGSDVVDLVILSDAKQVYRVSLLTLDVAGEYVYQTTDLRSIRKGPMSMGLSTISSASGSDTLYFSETHANIVRIYSLELKNAEVAHQLGGRFGKDLKHVMLCPLSMLHMDADSRHLWIGMPFALFQYDTSKDQLGAVYGSLSCASDRSKHVTHWIASEDSGVEDDMELRAPLCTVAKGNRTFFVERTGWVRYHFDGKIYPHYVPGQAPPWLCSTVSENEELPLTSCTYVEVDDSFYISTAKCIYSISLVKTAGLEPILFAGRCYEEEDCDSDEGKTYRELGFPLTYTFQEITSLSYYDNALLVADRLQNRIFAIQPIRSIASHSDDKNSGWGIVTLTGPNEVSLLTLLDPHAQPRPTFVFAIERDVWARNKLERHPEIVLHSVLPPELQSHGMKKTSRVTFVSNTSMSLSLGFDTGLAPLAKRNFFFDPIFSWKLTESGFAPRSKLVEHTLLYHKAKGDFYRLRDFATFLACFACLNSNPMVVNILMSTQLSYASSSTRALTRPAMGVLSPLHGAIDLGSRVSPEIQIVLWNALLFAVICVLIVVVRVLIKRFALNIDSTGFELTLRHAGTTLCMLLYVSCTYATYRAFYTASAGYVILLIAVLLSLSLGLPAYGSYWFIRQSGAQWVRSYVEAWFSPSGIWLPLHLTRTHGVFFAEFNLENSRRKLIVFAFYHIMALLSAAPTNHLRGFHTQVGLAVILTIAMAVWLVVFCPLRYKALNRWRAATLLSHAVSLSVLGARVSEGAEHYIVLQTLVLCCAEGVLDIFCTARDYMLWPLLTQGVQPSLLSSAPPPPKDPTNGMSVAPQAPPPGSISPSTTSQHTTTYSNFQQKDYHYGSAPMRTRSLSSSTVHSTRAMDDPPAPRAYDGRSSFFPRHQGYAERDASTYSFRRDTDSSSPGSPDISLHRRGVRGETPRPYGASFLMRTDGEPYRPPVLEIRPRSHQTSPDRR